MVTVNLKTKSPKTKINDLPASLEVETSKSVDDLSASISKAIKLGPERLRLTLIDNTLLVAGSPLEKYDLQENSIIYVKDLGRQISWRTVFFIEYVGPLLIHPIFFFLQKPIYGKSFEHTTEQELVYVLVMLHFIKRELETAFVHKFSNGTMPIFNIFKNSGHYWILSGFNLAYWVYSPGAKPYYSDTALKILIAAWIFTQVSNLITHLNLASLRPAGSKVRAIPYGYGFSLVSVPNYFFETLSWLIVTIVSRSVSSLIFLVVGTTTMYIWAIKKHKRYRKEFPKDYPKNRKAMFPFIA
ncbi:3-oxo-5-alpha-steroid 4-dehydrogenase-domain-containing protein [Lipomyces japonicus]|uniref:3-oxo-5-alpha-steroid 4-dehydrogenase-domain-containing protein n=1 Tax=Lipomyces japonicus TaxID=56871 RepID=UPI0034CD9A57